MRTNDTSELSHTLDELEEKRNRATIKMVEYHRQDRRQKEKIIKPITFKKGDHILRHTFNEEKLKPNDESKNSFDF